MKTPSPAIHVPVSIGEDALDELDRVPWHKLAHAYGVGRVGPALHEDVEATLRNLRARDEEVREEAMDTLYSNVCHQGTIYEATAYAFPFLAAFAAGAKLSDDELLILIGLLGEIGIAASYDAPNGSHSGAWGVDVGTNTRHAIRVSGARLSTVGLRHSEAAPVMDALRRLVERDEPAPGDVDRLQAALEAFEESRIAG